MLGTDPPPPPPRHGRKGSASPNPPPSTATKEGEGGVGQIRAIPPTRKAIFFPPWFQQPVVTDEAHLLPFHSLPGRVPLRASPRLSLSVPGPAGPGHWVPVVQRCAQEGGGLVWQGHPLFQKRQAGRHTSPGVGYLGHNEEAWSLPCGMGQEGGGGGGGGQGLPKPRFPAAPQPHLRTNRPKERK